MRKYIDIIREAAEGGEMSLTDAILKVRARYNEEGVTTQEIGDGDCAEFSSNVLKTWKGEKHHMIDNREWQEVETLNFCIQDDDDEVEDWDWTLLENHWGITPPQGYSHEELQSVAREQPYHVWITLDRKHYDAESPEGVSSFFELGFFQRWIQHAKGTNPSPSSATE